jgi:hypothetical protein
VITAALCKHARIIVSFNTSRQSAKSAEHALTRYP